MAEKTAPGKPRPLTMKQRVFIEVYLETLNGVESARRAGYKGNYATLGVVAAENLKKPRIREHIDQRLQEAAMSADEVIFRLTRMAQANIGDVIRIDPDGSWTFDMEKVCTLGNMIKKVRSGRQGITVEMQDAQAALEKLGRYYGLWKESLVHSGQVEVDISGGLTDEQLLTLAKAALEARAAGAAVAD